MTSDHELMLSVRNGNTQKLGDLFKNHHKHLYNFFLKCTGDTHSSEDLVQDVFFRMLKYRHTYRENGQFIIWMFQIARNARIDYMKKQKNLIQSESVQDQLQSKDLNPEEELEKKHTSSLIQKALSRLSDDKREVIVLSRFYNMPYQKISAIVGCSESAVKVRIFRALKELGQIYHTLTGGSI